MDITWFVFLTKLIMIVFYRRVHGLFLGNLGPKNLTQHKPYPSVVLAWIPLPGLPSFLFRQKIVEAIGGLIGKVVKLDLQTDNRTRCRFAHLSVFLNLDKPLVSKVLVNGEVQRVESLVAENMGTSKTFSRWW